MRIDKLSKMKGGWFIGNFEPTVLKTDKFEVCYKVHLKGDRWPQHIHKIATEYNCLVKGKMIIGEHLLESGDIFVIEPNELADPEFLEDCEIVIVKTPSVIGDKYEI